MSDHNAQNQIKLGLEKRRQKPAVTFGAPPTKAEMDEFNQQSAAVPVTSAEALGKLAIEAEAGHAGLTMLLDQTSAQIHEERETIIANLRHYGLSLAEAQAHPLAGGVLSTHVQNTADKRITTMATLIKAVAVAEASEPLFSSPAAMLQTSMLLNDRKKQYVESLQSSGPNELNAMTVKAIAEGDAALGSAVLTITERLNPEMKKHLDPGLRDRIANHFMGAHHRAAQSALAVIKGRFRSAQLANNSFSKTGRRSAESKLSHGLNVNRERA